MQSLLELCPPSGPLSSHFLLHSAPPAYSTPLPLQVVVRMRDEAAPSWGANSRTSR